MKNGDFSGAIANYTKAIKIDPNYADAYINRGLAKDNLEDYYGAIADYNKAIELDPNDAVAYYNRGVVKEIINETSAKNIESWLKEGHFWRGTMEPKIRASLYFLKYHGEEVVITSIKNIEKAISKTIAAFSNADGGVLIIGVDDDGNILGLESDYSTLEGDQDNFELHLRALIMRDFGPLFSKENIKINFHEIEDQEICQVQISKRIKPTYLEVTDKMGNKNKKFYIRSGNQSIEIQINEVTEYIKNRF